MIHVYAPSLVATVLGSATVIWQTKSGNAEVKNELKADISRIEKKMGIMNDNILTIAREATTAMYGNKKP